MDVRIGLCGFTIAMEDYALHFPVIEVQNTFYEPPRDEVMQRWRAVTAPTLEYTMKVWQLVTHSASSPTYRRMKRPLGADAAPGFFRDSAAVAEGWQRSVQCATVLSATALLFQCPASFAPDRENVEQMRRFFERIARPAAQTLRGLMKRTGSLPRGCQCVTWAPCRTTRTDPSAVSSSIN